MSEQKQAGPPQSDAEALARAHAIYETLLTGQQSIMLATINADGSPLASYAPFAVDSDKNFYIFISTLSHHTDNLLRTGQASLMLIADEAETPQIFARNRLTFSCQVEALARESEDWPDAAARYEERFGDFFRLVRGFSDFRMFRLAPTEGSLVVGFGQAYTVQGDALDQLTLRRG